MRMNAYLYSERFNPLMLGVANAASLVREDRQPAAEENPYIGIEQQVSRSISESLDGYRKLRDTTYQQMFNWIYG